MDEVAGWFMGRYGWETERTGVLKSLVRSAGGFEDCSNGCVGVGVSVGWCRVV